MWPISEDRLFERFRRRRDGASLAAVFDRVAPALQRVASHLCRDPHAAEDLVQQTFLAAIERAERWDPERGLFPWLVGILTNRARLHRRAEQRTPVAERLSQPAVEQPDDAAERRELEAAVDAAIAELGDTYRPVLHLHLLHGLNAKEIAAALGRPAGSVRTQLVRGLTRLRAALPVGLGVALASSASLLAMRQRLLDALPAADAAGAASLAATLMIGGSMVKKWTLLGIVLLFGVVAGWQAVGSPGAFEPAGAGAAQLDVSAVDVKRHGAGAVNDANGVGDRDVSRTLAGPLRDSAATPGSIEVRCQAALALPDGSAAEEGLAGAWVQVRGVGQGWRDRRFGADTDADGVARFADVPAGEWHVVAVLGVLRQSSTIVLEPGRSLDIELTFDSVTGVDVHVVDEGHRPVADAEVWVALGIGLRRVRPMEVTTRMAGRTDGNGKVRVAAGPVAHIGARKAGYSASLTARTELASTGPLTLVLRSGGGAIDGEARDERGRAIAGARVFLSPVIDDAGGNFRTADGSPGLPPTGIRVDADEHGRFTIDGLAAARYRCIAIAPGALDAELEVEVRDHERSPAAFVLQASTELHGLVVRRGGQPAPGLDVTCRALDGRRFPWSSARTDEQGHFTIDVPRAGYHVMVERGERMLAEARSQAVLTGPVEVELTVTEERLASGRVIDERGEPMADWYVVGMPDGERSLLDVMRAGHRDCARTDSAGRFELWGTPTGAFTVAAVARLGGRYHDLPPPQLHGVVVGSADLELVVPDRWLSRATIAARVVDAEGQVIATAEVALMTQSDAAVACEQGQVRCTAVTYGEQRLHVTAAGYGTVSVKTVVEGPAIDLGDIVLQRAVELRVRPRLPAGQPWRGPLPRPWLKHGDGGLVASQEAQVEGGIFVFRCLPPGSYRIVPHFRDSVAASPLPLELRAGVPLTLDWPVQAGFRVALEFTEDPATPIDPQVVLTITVRNARGEIALHEAQPRGSNPGWLVLQPLAAGRHRVEASCPNGRRYEGEFEVELTDETPRFEFEPRR